QFANFIQYAGLRIEILELLIVVTDVERLIPLQLAIDWRTCADQRAKQRCLSGSIGAENGPPFAALHFELNPANQRHVFVSDRQIARGQNIAAAAVYRHKPELHFRRRSLWLLERLHSSQQLAARLGLFGLLSCDVAPSV